MSETKVYVPLAGVVDPWTLIGALQANLVLSNAITVSDWEAAVRMATETKKAMDRVSRT